MNSINFLKFFSHFFSSTPIYRHFGKKYFSESLIKPCKYYFEKLSLTPEEICAGALGLTSIIFILFSLLFTFFKVHFVVALIVSAILSYLAYNFFTEIIITEYKKEQFILEKFSDLIARTMHMGMGSTGSLFRAIQLVAQSNFPLISKDFQGLIYQINNGCSPEELLYNYAIQQPSKTLKNQFLALLSSPSINNDLVTFSMNLTQFELRTEYDKFTEELESRVMIIIGLALFIPILSGIFLAIYGLSSSYLILTIVPIYVLLVRILKKFLIKTHAELLG